MLKNAWSETMNWQTWKCSNFKKFHILVWMTINSKKKKKDLLQNCSQFVRKLFWNICTWLVLVDLIFFWSVNKLSRVITKWTKACDKRLARLISYIHHTYEFRQYCFVGNTAQQCRLGLFQDSNFAGDLEDSKSTSKGILCIFGSHTFVPTSWMCKIQTSVSHSSTEADIISLDAGSRMDGIPALDLWDSVIEVCHSSQNQSNKSKDQSRWNLQAQSKPKSNQARQSWSE